MGWDSAMARAGIGKALIQAFQRARPQQIDALQHAIGDAAWRSHDTCNALRWVPLSHHMSIVVATRAIVGPDGQAVRYWTQAWNDLLSRAGLKWFAPIAPGLKRTSEMMLEYGPRVLQQMFKGVGDVHVAIRDPGPNEYGEWNQSGFDTARYHFDAYIEGTLGALEAGTQLLSETSTVELAEKNASAGSFVVRFDKV
ncbi:MAG: hypothetical protein AAF645_02225 [Myxococcota bacterium]